MARDARNPFDPPRERVPLTLTLDSRTLAEPSAELRPQVEYLQELGQLDLVDPLVAWSEPRFSKELPTAELGAARLELDDRLVVHPGESGFIGVVRLVSQYERIADEYELQGSDRAFLLHYGPLVSFHRSAQRMLLVTAEDRLLRIRETDPMKNLWRQARAVSVPLVLKILGLLMRRHGKTALEVRGGSRRWINNYTLRQELAIQLLPHRQHFYENPPKAELSEVEQKIQAYHGSLLDRMYDLIFARDQIAFTGVRTAQNWATVDEILFNLRACVATAAAMFDATALLTCAVLQINEEDTGGRQSVSWVNRKFRRLVRDRGGAKTEAHARALLPVLRMIGAFRHPILHREGIGGTTFTDLSRGHASESRVLVSDEQVAAFASLGQSAPEEWGLRARAGMSDLEPVTFTTTLLKRVAGEVDGLLAALGEDLGQDPPEPFGRVFLEAPADVLRVQWTTGISWP